MKAVINLDVPDWQIGQNVTVYFPDSMVKCGKCELLKEQEEVEPIKMQRMDGNKEINFPVLVMDDECMTCDELDIISDRERLYAGDQCVLQDIRVRCSNVYKCMKIQKSLEKRAGVERQEGR